MTTELASVMMLPVTLIVISAPFNGSLGSSLDCDKSADQLPTHALWAACWSRCSVPNPSAPAMLRIVASSSVVMSPSSALDTAEPHLDLHARALTRMPRAVPSGTHLPARLNFETLEIPV